MKNLKIELKKLIAVYLLNAAFKLVPDGPFKIEFAKLLQNIEKLG